VSLGSSVKFMIYSFKRIVATLNQRDIESSDHRVIGSLTISGLTDPFFPMAKRFVLALNSSGCVATVRILPSGLLGLSMAKWPNRLMARWLNDPMTQ